MSYDNSSGTAILSRTLGLGHTIMLWGKVVIYPGTTIWSLFHADVNFDTPNIGGVAVATTLSFDTTPTAVPLNVETGSNTTWAWLCLIPDDTVAFNYQCFWRLAGTSSITSGTLGSKSAGSLVKFYLMNNPPTSHNVQCRISAYKEWTNYNSLGTGSTLLANLLAESQSNAPVITAGNCNYLSCAVGSTIGQDTSPSAHNWTVSGTITTNADEPNMSIAPGGAAINAVGLHYVTA